MVVHVIINVVMMMDHAHVLQDIQPMIAIHVTLDIMCQTHCSMKIHVQVRHEISCHFLNLKGESIL